MAAGASMLHPGGERGWPSWCSSHTQPLPAPEPCLQYNNIIPGALSFPTGLLLIVLCGAELFTGNCCYMFSANIELKANWWQHLKIIFSAYFWNLIGSLILVGLEVGIGGWGPGLMFASTCMPTRSCALALAGGGELL